MEDLEFALRVLSYEVKRDDPVFADDREQYLRAVETLRRITTPFSIDDPPQRHLRGV